MGKLIFLATCLILCSCESKPTVVQPASQDSNISNASTPSTTETAHEAIVEEILQTTKYTYLFLDEGGVKRWIAIARAEVNKGEKVKYTGGLRMANFKSTELNRNFEELLLVSNIQRAGDRPAGNLFQEIKEGGSPIEKEKITIAKGSISLIDLFRSPEKFAGKKVLVSGRCIKINYQIMGKNWIHLEDESGASKTLTITSQSALEPGKLGSFEGTITLNKDFGAGYQYDIILEDAVLK